MRDFANLATPLRPFSDFVISTAAVSAFPWLNPSMKSPFLLAALLLCAPLAAVAADKPGAATKSADAIKRHPLKGVVTGILAERSSLLVKHEEIPGVMRAMTMAFKVDDATLKTAKEGQAITGMMSRQGSAWVLENVKVIGGKKS